MIKWPHARDNGMMGPVTGTWRGDVASCVKAEHKTPLPVCKFGFCSTVEVGKMYYSVVWLLKIMSTSRVIVLEAD